MSERTRARPMTLLVLALVTALGCGLAASTWHVFGHTWDEPEHIAAGMSLVDHGRYIYDIQHPPIARALLAVGPYLAGARSQGTPPPDGMPEGLKILYGGGHYDLYLTLARAGVLPFLALLIVVTYLWGRSVTGEKGALLAAAFVATTPAVLGHAAIATLDVAAAATCLLALWTTRRWFDSGRLMDALGLGLALGLALGTKLSAIPFCGLGALVLLVVQTWERRGRADARAPVGPGQWLAGATITGLIVIAVLTAAYGGRMIYLTDAAHHFNQALWYLFGASGTLHDWGYAVFASVPVPEAMQWLIGGIQALQVHNAHGHESYLLGQFGLSGWWYFYPVALLVKTPLPLLLLGLGGLVLLVRRGLAEHSGAALAPPLLFAALMGFAIAVSHINIGVRHVLVLYPLLAIGAAVQVERILAALAARPRGLPRTAGQVALIAVCAAQLLTVAVSWPDYLAYFNMTAPEPERVLVDSDLDWGQDLQRLSRRLHELGVPSVSLAYLGSADLRYEQLPPYVWLAPDEHATGWVAVTALARVHAPGRFAWLDAYPRRERIGKTIDLYLVPPGAP